VFYTTDYHDWKLCNYDGEDTTCSDQYIANLDVGTSANDLPAFMFHVSITPACASVAVRGVLCGMCGGSFQ
jgi:hypothetical protein